MTWCTELLKVPDGWHAKKLVSTLFAKMCQLTAAWGEKFHPTINTLVFQSFWVKVHQIHHTNHMVITTPSTIMLLPTYLMRPWPWPLTFWPQNLMRLSLPQSPSVVKVGLIPSTNTQDIVLTMFVQDGRTDARTLWKQRHNYSEKSISHISLRYNL